MAQVPPSFSSTGSGGAPPFAEGIFIVVSLLAIFCWLLASRLV